MKRITFPHKNSLLIVSKKLNKVKKTVIGQHVSRRKGWTWQLFGQKNLRKICRLTVPLVYFMNGEKELKLMRCLILRMDGILKSEGKQTNPDEEICIKLNSRQYDSNYSERRNI